MAISRNRDLAGSLGQAVHKNQITLAGGLAISGVTTYTTKANLPSGYDSNNAGSLGFTTDSDRLYVHTGQGWFNIAIVNTNPIWETQPSSEYTLNNDATAYHNGTATTITLAARDSEGFPLTWSYVADSAFNNMAYISNDSSVFTIEPKSKDSAGGLDIMPTGTVTFKASDGVNIISGSSDFILSFDARIKNTNYTAVLAKANGNNLTNATFTDASTNGRTITAHGHAHTTGFTPYHPGESSLYFDGTNDRVDVAASSQFLIGTNNFTLECWVLIESVGVDTKNRRIFMLDGPSGNSNGNIQLFVDDTNGEVDVYTNSGDLHMQSTVHASSGKWHHVALVRSSTGSQGLKLYIDGLLDASATYGSSIGTHNSSQPRPRIGSYSSSDGNFKGYIYDLRLVVGTAVYTADFTPPSRNLEAITNTKLLIQGVYPYLKDKSTYNHAITANTTIYDTESNIGTFRKVSPHPHEKYVYANSGSSGLFDGNGDYLSVSDHDASFDLADGNFTIEGWIFPMELGNYDTIACQVGTWAIEIHNYRITVWLSTGTGGSWDILSTVAISDALRLNEWVHFALVRNGNTIKGYQNGVEKYSATKTQTIGNSSSDLRIGWYDGSSHYFDGLISDFRIVKGTAVYTSAFTPPTSKLTAISNTSFYLQSTAGMYDAGGGAAHWIPTGNVKSSTGTLKYASSNMDFDGNGDYIKFSVPGDVGFYAGDGTFSDFTAEAWIYHDSRSSDQHWFGLGAGNPSITAGCDNSGNFFIKRATDKKINASAVISTNTWYHVAVVRSKGNQNTETIRAYVNGVQAGSDWTTQADYALLADTCYVGTSGSHTSQSMHGHIEDFRLTKGLSRYPFAPLKETLTPTTSWQGGKTVGGSGGHTKIICCHSATLTADASATGRTLVVNMTNATHSNYSPGGDMKSVYFDGTADYISANTSTSDFVLGTGDYTFETWVNFKSFPQTVNTLAGTTISAGGNVLYWHAKTDRLSIGTQTTWIRDTQNFTWTTNRWYHVAICRISANTKLFVDGYMIDSFGSDTTSYTADGFRVAANNSGANAMNGWLSNTRLIVGTGIYDNAFTPPTAELTV